jgi:hypothetical protein
LEIIPRAKLSGTILMKLKLQKRSEWKFVGRIIPHKQIFNNPQLAVEPVSKACFGVHTRDSEESIFFKKLHHFFGGGHEYLLAFSCKRQLFVPISNAYNLNFLTLFVCRFNK